MQTLQDLNNKLKSSIELYELLKSIENENISTPINNIPNATSKAYCEILQIKNIILKTIIIEWYKSDNGNKLFIELRDAYVSKEVAVRIKNNIADNIRYTFNANPYIIQLLSLEQKRYIDQIEIVKKKVIDSIKNFDYYCYWPDNFTKLENTNVYEIIMLFLIK